MAELRAYEPTWRDRIAGLLMGDERASPERRRFVEGLLGSSGLGTTGIGVIDVTPVGMPLGAQEALREGDYRGAAMAALPVVGAPARTAARAANTGAREIEAAATRGRGIINTPDLRNLSQAEAIAVAKQQPHLIQSSDGQFVGGPRGVATQEQLQTMRQNFDADVAAGASGGDWYERARAFNREIEGNNPYRQSLAAHEQALWSAQADPDTNMGFALNARTDYEAGVPQAQYRTGAQAENYVNARRARDEALAARSHNGGPPLDDEPTGLPKLGKKTGIYGQHLDPTQPPATTGTNDIWHARGFGYTENDGSTFSRALTDQEHRFLDYETMLAVDRANAAKLGGRDNWTAAEIQAAPWVAGKGRGLAARRGMSEAEGIAEASKTYPDYAPKYTVNLTSEQIPGKSTGLGGNLIEADDATKQAFSNAASWKNADGQDIIPYDMGLPTRRTQDATGYYINSAGKPEMNPVEIGLPMTGFTKNAEGNPVLNPRAEAGFTAGQAVRGLIDMQEGSAWNKMITHGAGGDKNSLAIDLGRPPTKAELAAFDKIASENGFIMANAENGLSFINTKEGRTTTSLGKELRADLEAKIRAASPDATVSRARGAGDYVDLSGKLAKENAGKGEATKDVVDRLKQLEKEAPGFYQKLLESQGIADKANANLSRLDQFGLLGQRPDYERLLKIIGEDKLKGLLKRVEMLGYEGLPAVALPVAGAAGIGAGLLGPSDAKAQEAPYRRD